MTTFIATATATGFNPWFLLVIPLLVIALASRKKKDKKPTGPDAYRVIPLAPGWHLGPVVQGTNRTRGIPRPGLVRTPAGFRVPFPGQGGSLHAVQTADLVLAGKRELVVRYRITGDASFVPTDPKNRHNPARICLVLQRNGDDWAATDTTRFYRLYSKAGDVLAPGTFELRLPLTAENLGPVQYGGLTQPHVDAVLRDLHSLHIAFGSNGGRAHGVYATAPAEFELLGVEVH